MNGLDVVILTSYFQRLEGNELIYLEISPTQINFSVNGGFVQTRLLEVPIYAGSDSIVLIGAKQNSLAQKLNYFQRKLCRNGCY